MLDGVIIIIITDIGVLEGIIMDTDVGITMDIDEDITKDIREEQELVMPLGVEIITMFIIIEVME